MALGGSRAASSDQTSRAVPQRLAVFCATLALVFALATPSGAKNRLVVFPSDAEQWPAMLYSTLDGEGCLAELSNRGIPYARADKIPTIDAPVTLEGDLRGVRFEFAYTLPEKSKKRVLDCRLLLALDDFATIAKAQQIAVVRYNSAYRGRWARVRGARHVAGVAIDIVEFVKHDGEVLNVLRDFKGDGIGSNTCSVPTKIKPRFKIKPRNKPLGPKATDLRTLVCTLDSARIFNLVLTPHYDRRHRDHFHLEVRRGIRWFLTQ
jgi:hypothetical protein